jgi:hypothetical protein
VIGRKELATDASKVEAPPVKSLRLKDPSQSRYIGNDGINSVDAFDVTRREPNTARTSICQDRSTQSSRGRP